MRIVPTALIVALALIPAFPAYAEGWQPYRFKAGETYKYEITWTQEGETSKGHFSLGVTDAGAGDLEITMDGKLGEMSCSSTVTVDSVDAIAQQIMMGCMMMGPAMALLVGPSTAYWAGHELSDDASWKFEQGGESLSFAVEGSCEHAGRTGKLAVMKQNDEVKMRSCVSNDLALPLEVEIRDRNDVMQATLVGYGQ